MKKTNAILTVVALISIGFNVFFVSGYARARSTLTKLGSPEGRVQLLAHRLGLSKTQEERIIELRRQLQQEIKEFDELHDSEIGEFWAEMVKDEPDPDKIQLQLKATSNHQEDMRALKTDYLGKVFSLLTPEQRRKVALMIRERSFLQQLQ